MGASGVLVGSTAIIYDEDGNPVAESITDPRVNALFMAATHFNLVDPRQIPDFNPDTATEQQTREFVRDQLISAYADYTDELRYVGIEFDTIEEKEFSQMANLLEPETVKKLAQALAIQDKAKLAKRQIEWISGEKARNWFEFATHSRSAATTKTLLAMIRSSLRLSAIYFGEHELGTPDLDIMTPLYAIELKSGFFEDLQDYVQGMFTKLNLKHSSFKESGISPWRGPNRPISITYKDRNKNTIDGRITGPAYLFLTCHLDEQYFDSQGNLKVDILKETIMRIETNILEPDNHIPFKILIVASYFDMQWDIHKMAISFIWDQEWEIDIQKIE